MDINESTLAQIIVKHATDYTFDALRRNRDSCWDTARIKKVYVGFVDAIVREKKNNDVPILDDIKTYMRVMNHQLEGLWSDVVVNYAFRNALYNIKKHTFILEEERKEQEKCVGFLTGMLDYCATYIDLE